MLEQLRTLQQANPDKEVLATNLAYLSKREEQMQYPHFQVEGWPLGSGVVESANKVVVEARLKGAGMHWERSHVNPMLGLRNVVCNDRWAEAWPAITARLHKQKRAHKPKQVVQGGRYAEQDHQQQQVRNMATATVNKVHPTMQLKSTEPAASFTPDDGKDDKPKAPWRPAPDHPWRRSPIGRARFQTLKAS